MINKTKLLIIGIFVGFINGLLGSGGGSLLVPCLKKFICIKPHKAHATAIAVILPMSIVSIFIYFFRMEKFENYYIILWISLGGVVGGFLGAKFLCKIPKKWLSKIFGLFLILAAVKMIA